MAVHPPEVRSGPKLWTDLTPLVRSRGKKHAAIAFIGKEAPDLLPLRRGDVLVVNAGDPTLASGGTSPDALRAFLNRGVEVWSHPYLHAKVISISRGITVVGSANASTRSGSLLEAVAVLSDDASRTAAVDFVVGLAGHAQRVDAAFLKRADGLFRPPAGRPGDDSAAADIFTQLPERLWIWHEGEGDSQAVAKPAQHAINAMPSIDGAEYSYFQTDLSDPLRPRDVLIRCTANGWLVPPGIAQQLPSGGAIAGGQKKFAVELFDPNMKHRRTSKLPRNIINDLQTVKDHPRPWVLVTDRPQVRRIMNLWLPEL